MPIRLRYVSPNFALRPVLVSSPPVEPHLCAGDDVRWLSI